MAIAQPSTFAHETLELIFSFCDVPTLAAVGRVSSACLELSVPFLYEHIVLSDHKTCDLFFQKSRRSTERVARALSLSRVRTVAILFRPIGDVYNRGRIPNQTTTGLQVDALKLEIQVRTPKARLCLRKNQPFHPDDDYDNVDLHNLLSLFNPSDFLFVTSPGITSSWIVRCDGDWNDVGWDRIATVVSAGPNPFRPPNERELDFSREQVQYIHDHTCVVSCWGLAYIVQKEHLSDKESRSSPPRVWVTNTKESSLVVRNTSVEFGLSEHDVEELVSFEINLTGHEGWWADQKAKKKIAPAA